MKSIAANDTTSRKAWVLVTAGLTAGALFVAQPAWAEDCPLRRERSQVFHHFTTWQVVQDVAYINLFEFAGDSPDPRPFVEKSLGDVRRGRRAEFINLELDRRFALPTHTFFALYDDRAQSPDDEVVSVPRALLWCFVHEGDMVLLSDRVTHHYTQVHKVDRAGQRIAFADRWPDQIFLRHGQNKERVRAQLSVANRKAAVAKLMAFTYPTVDAKTSAAYNEHDLNMSTARELQKSKPSLVVEITKAEFNRVAVGVVTFDSFDIADEYLAAVHDSALRARALSSFSAIASRSGEALRGTAAQLAARAHMAAKDVADTELRASTAGRLLYALLSQQFGAAARGDAVSARAHEASVIALNKEVPSETAMRSWVAVEFYRMGNAAGRANAIVAAIGFYDRAIARDPSLEEAYFYRAVAKTKKGIPDFLGATEDVSQALRQNAIRTTEVNERKLKRHPNDSQGKLLDDAELITLRDRRLNYTQVLATVSSAGR